MVASYNEYFYILTMLLFSLFSESVELIMGELNEIGAEGSTFEKVPAEENIVDTSLYNGIDSLRESSTESPAPVLSNG